MEEVTICNRRGTLFKVVGFFFIRGQQLSEGSVYCGDVGGPYADAGCCAREKV